MKSEIYLKKFRGVKPINAFIITVLEGCGEVDDPYREVQYVVQITEDGYKILCEYIEGIGDIHESPELIGGEDE